jgi:phage terminase Nu1 subunit (DNA packaging protein)
MAKTDRPANFDTLSASDVADLLGVTEKTVRNWMNKKGLPSVDGQRGRVLRWRDVLEWYVELRKSEDGNSGNGSSKTAPQPVPDLPPETMENAMRRRAIAEADLKELDRAQRLSEVVAIEDVGRNIAAVAKNIQQKLLNVPTKLTTRLVGIDDRNRVRAILDAEMLLICNELVTVGAETAKRTPREVREE